MLRLFLTMALVGLVAGMAKAHEPKAAGDQPAKRPELTKEKREKVIEVAKRLPEESGAPVLGSKLEILEDVKSVFDVFSED